MPAPNSTSQAFPMRKFHAALLADTSSRSHGGSSTKARAIIFRSVILLTTATAVLAAAAAVVAVVGLLIEVQPSLAVAAVMAVALLDSKAAVSDPGMATAARLGEALHKEVEAAPK